MRNMGTKRKQHGAKFKAQVAMAALSGEKTLAELSSEYGVHVTMISTWKQELVKRAEELFERDNKKAVDPQKEIDNLHRKNPAIPRIFFTHDNYLKDYTGNADSKKDYYGKKVILLARNPLDTTVSQYFQWKFRMRPGKKALNDYPEHGSDMDVFPFMMDRDAGLPKVIDYLNLWAREAPKCADFLLVRYEDMRADTAGTLERIVTFIGTPGTPEQITGAVEFASVENMRAMETKGTFWKSGSRMVAKDASNPDSFKVRKAKVGGYRDYFDDAQVLEMQALVKKELSGFYDFPLEELKAASSAG